jgi:hypothetical protein
MSCKSVYETQRHIRSGAGRIAVATQQRNFSILYQEKPKILMAANRNMLM